MATGVDLIAFSLFLLLSFVLALLKAFPVMIAGQILSVRHLGYVWAAAYFFLIFVCLSVVKALIGTLYISDIWLVLLDAIIFSAVMWGMLYHYQIIGLKRRAIFFTIGLLLNELMMLGLFYLLFRVPTLPLSFLLPR